MREPTAKTGWPGTKHPHGDLTHFRVSLERSASIPAFGGSWGPGYRARSERFIGARCRGVVRSSVLATGVDLVPTVTADPHSVLPVKRRSGHHGSSASATMDAGRAAEVADRDPRIAPPDPRTRLHEAACEP